MPLEPGQTYNMMVVGVKHYKDTPMRGGVMHRIFDITLRDVNEMTFNCSYPSREMENTHFVIGQTACFVVMQQMKTTYEIDPCQFTANTKLSAEPPVGAPATNAPAPPVMTPYAPPPGKDMPAAFPQDADTAALYMGTMIACARIHAGLDTHEDGLESISDACNYADHYRTKLRQMKALTHLNSF